MNMNKFHPFVKSLTISYCSCLLFLLQQPTAITTTTASSPSPPNRETLQSTLEAARYSSLPPTVFAPGGRLYGVERVAKEALLLDDDGVDSDEEVSSCGVLALHCCGFQRNNGSKTNNNDDGKKKDGEFAVMVGIGATSSFLHRDEAYLNDPPSPTENTLSTTGNNHHHHVGETYLPLTIDEEDSTSQPTPLSILSPTLIAGAGGKAIDSKILLRRTTEVALSMYSNDNGGVDWFVSHSLEGTTTMTQGNDIMPSSSWSSPTIMGGVAGVDVSSLVRRVADMAQSSTQSLGGRYGRMLSSSLLAVGARNPSNLNKDDDNDTLSLWRVDPTGQFWRLDASAVGRGATNVESELLRRVRSWRMEQTTKQQDGGDESEWDDILQQEDVRGYLGSLSVEEAVEVAKDCLVDGILMGRRKQQQLANNDVEDGRVLMKQLEQGLRKRVQAVVIRSSNDFGQSKPFIEIV